MMQPNFQAPYSQEAEESVLGSILIDDSQLISIDGILRSANDFYFLKHRLIYQAMLRCKSRDGVADAITIADELDNTGDLSDIGGRAFLLNLANKVGTSTHVEVYTQLVRRCAIRRDMLQATDKMRALALDESSDLEAVRAQADSEWLNATSDVVQHTGQWMGDVIAEVYDEVERMMYSDEKITGLPTGLKDVDNLVRGFEDDQLIIIAGRPGMGKSAAVDNIVLNLARKGVPIFYATSERSAKQVVRRMATIWTAIPMVKLKEGRLNGQEIALFTKAIAEIANLPIYFHDAGEPTPREIYAQADWMIKRHGCKAIFFDGMYRSRTGDPNYDRNDRTKYGRVALELKSMARALHVPVITTHQLSRAVEQRQDKRPVMSDLRESGRIEEEADKIIFLYRDEVYNDASEFPNQCDWILAKHRDGATGICSTYFEKTIVKFMDGTVHRAEIPQYNDF